MLRRKPGQDLGVGLAEDADGQVFVDHIVPGSAAAQQFASVDAAASAELRDHPIRLLQSNPRVMNFSYHSSYIR